VLNRVPIRVRLTLAFALAMAVVLGAMGVFVYFRVSATLVSSADQALRAQAPETKARIEHGQRLSDRDVSEGATLVQVIGPNGTILRSTPSRLRRLLDPQSVARARAGHDVFRDVSLPLEDEHWRLLARSVRLSQGLGVYVIGRSLDARDEALDRLLRQFLLAGPVALLLAALGGYLLAGAALRPVEAMRLRAQAMTGSIQRRRLPVPESGDEISRLAETLNDLLGRVEAAFAHEVRFVADASHELRTPLALLKAELEIALRHPRSRTELESALRSAAEETDRLARLAEDLLLIARGDHAELPIRAEELLTAEIFEEVAERFALRASAEGRAIEIESAGPFAVDADRMRLEQALGNLVDNAVAHGAGPVTLAARASGNLVELHVLDEGSGFPGDFVERAFDRFSRADEARGRGGTGLGLAIVELIARAHGGAAGAANRAGGGADVWIAVPRATVGVSPPLPEPGLRAAPTR
jgi:signal transduction histidine kinase